MAGPIQERAPRGRAGRRKRRPMGDINVTPLVDVMLVLLIVFMITAPLLTTGVAVDLPRAESSPLPGQDEPLSVSIDVQGRVFLQESEIALDQLETRWTFTPSQPWRAGTYELLALDILEDVAGNQIGRAFEVDNFESVDKSPNPQTITIPFSVK